MSHHTRTMTLTLTIQHHLTDDDSPIDRADFHRMLEGIVEDLYHDRTICGKSYMAPDGNWYKWEARIHE